ncbi:MAG: hypothetical protein QOG31_1727 [Thermoplasmata archaeon]|jgi:hypothetical protein|nr:hypothetical protein [Thermoplasmata archaeon]
MRTLLLVALVAAVLAAPVQAQMDFGQSYQVRAGVGDIPSTQAVERAGAWNVEQRLTVPLGGAKDLHFTLPAGSALETVACTCASFTRQAQAGAVTVSLAANNTGNTATVTVLSSQPFSTAVAFSLRAPPEAGKDAAVILYVPMGSAFEAPGTATSPGSSTDGTATIQALTYTAASPLPDPFWAAIHPGATTTAPAPPAAGFPWLQAVAAFVLGLLLWAFLVQRGIVQTRGRKQVAQVAAHTEIAAQDPPAVLEGKKRALLAALKEVEMARQAQEMDTATYDAVKADFKRQAVTVMRALDEGAGKQA